MSRRPHKKSRNGCFECKKRHMRCDGNHPICVNCNTAEIRCSFLGRESPLIVPAYPDGQSSTAAYNTILTAAPKRYHEPTKNTERSIDPYSVNMTHIELFNNLHSKEFLVYEESGYPDIIPAWLYEKHALTTPYLMHQMLATSALQLSTTATESRDFYREHATGLQNRALSLFSEINPVLEVNSSNCVHVFLFSSMIGVHLLCETLYYQRDSLETFVDSFTHCLSVSHGVATVLSQCERLIDDTELGPRLRLSRIETHSTDSRGSECRPLWSLVDAADISPSSQEAYREAISYLQQIFDARRTAAGHQIPNKVFSWPILVSPNYVVLLRQQQPEALIILAHFAVLLHHGRDLWAIGDGGQFLIETICGTLDSQWQQWLQLPKAALAETLTA